MLVKYDEDTYEEVIEAFMNLPLAALVNGQYLALHGGVSSRLKSFDQINEIDRQSEPPLDECLFNDLLWADPLKSSLALTTDEIANEDRYVSVKFGWPILKDLLKEKGLKAMIRAHQQKDAGYKLHMWAGKNEDPVCITIFSAPNYCGHENPGSIFVTGSPKVKDRVLCYDEYDH